MVTHSFWPSQCCSLRGRRHTRISLVWSTSAWGFACLRWVSPCSSRPRFAAFGPLPSPLLRLLAGGLALLVSSSVRSAPLRFASFRCVRLGFACPVSFARLPISARSRLESLQVQQSVGWNQNVLGSGQGGWVIQLVLVAAQVQPCFASRFARYTDGGLRGACSHCNSLKLSALFCFVAWLDVKVRLLVAHWGLAWLLPRCST